MRHTLLSLFLTLATITIGLEANAAVKPDFAFPDKIVRTSEQQLKKAIDSGDGPATLRALMNLTLARTAVDPDAMNDAIGKINSVIDATPEPATKAMLNLLLADIYTELYRADSYTYDRRMTPLEPLPADYKEWNGRQFKKIIFDRLADATADAHSLQAQPLSRWSDVVSSADNAMTRIYYPTLWDFVCNDAIDIASRLTPYGLSFNSSLYSASPGAPLPYIADAPARYVLESYASLIGAQQPGSAPDIQARLERLRFLRAHSAGESGEPFKAALDKLLADNHDSPWAGDILLAMADNGMTQTPASRVEMWRMTEDFLSKNPAYDRRNCLTNLVASLTRPSISVTLPNIICPGRPVQLHVEARNIKAGRIDIYKVDAGTARYVSMRNIHAKKIGSLSVSSAFVREPAECLLDLAYTFDEPGQYIVVPVLDENSAIDMSVNYDVITATRLIIASTQDTRVKLWAMDATTGAPVADAAFTGFGYRNARVDLGKTDPDGSVTVKDESRNYSTIVASTADDRSAPSYFSYYRSDTSRDVTMARSTAALPLYHPGDSVDWMAIIYTASPEEGRLLADRRIKAVMRDANYQDVATATLTTDAFGRIADKFKIPTGTLDGDYSITFEDADNGNELGRLLFMVSDYKLPTFAVTLDRPAATADGYIIAGRAVNYSGFPVADATVSLKVSSRRSSRWWWGGNPVEFADISATTDADGRFRIAISNSMLDSALYPTGTFTADAAVTSASGETQTATTAFARRPMRFIVTDNPPAIDISMPADIGLKVVDSDNKTVAATVTYTVSRGDSVVAEGSVPSDHRLDLRRLDSGRATIRFATADADTLSLTTVLYRPDDMRSPVDDVLWTPTQSVTTLPAKILVGTARPTHALYTLYDSRRLLEQKWIRLDAGMHNLSIKLPAGCTDATLCLNAVADYRQSSLRFDIDIKDMRPSISLDIESFRDKVTPGDKETWTIAVSHENTDPTATAIILDIYNEAITALQSQNANILPGKPSGLRFSWDAATANKVSVSAGGRLRDNRCPDITTPDFETWGRRFSGSVNRSLHIRGGMKLMSKASTYEKEAAVADMADNGAVMTEATGTVPEAAPAPATEAKAPEKPQESFAYRDAEMPLAAFEPMLTTGPDGKLVYSFTVPNANTRWVVDAFAVTPTLLGASKRLTMTASKPLMVQPNLPRFLRSGDAAVIPATLMNDTDEDQNIATTVEIFDPADNRILSTQTFETRVCAHGSSTVSVNVTAPDNMPLLGYRVKSSITGFTDGEQTAIAILPATSPVIESTPFYICPDSLSFSMMLPEARQGASMTLEFCENPIWSVVTALPGLRKADPMTAIQASEAILSAAAADGILRDNPAIAKALAQWASSDKSDSTLVSMLERNADLKTVLLQASPWVMDARDETERMQRLSLLFDRGEIARSIETSVNMLSSLRRDGAWCWTAQSTQPSRWATESVLRNLGALNEMGYLPKNRQLNSMIESALKWLDAQVVEDYRRNPGGNYTSYVALRDLFPDVAQSTAATRVSSATVQQLLGRWHDLRVDDKALAAKILDRHNYHATAMQILTSIREYSRTSPTKGMWWPSLQSREGDHVVPLTALILTAFATVDPTDTADIDAIRQWLILQKQALDWGNSAATTEVVAAIISTSRRWSEPAHNAVITIGGEELNIGKVNRTTGYLRTPLPAGDAGKEMTIGNPSRFPSWGAVYSKYVAPVSEIKAASIEGLSITKRTLVISETDNISATTDLAVGQKVRVELTIVSDRDMSNVVVTDDRAACLEPVDQMPGYIYSEGVGFYRINSDTATNLFIDFLPKGTYLLSYDLWVNNAGAFLSGIATIQCSRAPSLTAHSAALRLDVR